MPSETSTEEFVHGRSRPDSTMRLGSLVDASLPTASSGPPLVDGPLQLHLRVAVIDGNDLGAVAIIGSEPLVVGCDASCGLTLTDPAVSRQHVVLTRVDGGIRVEDRGSRNGTFLGGQRVDEAVAHVGSVLRVGRSTLALLMDGMTQEPEVPSSLGTMIGSSVVMKRLFSMVGRLAASDATVLIRGETGVGKELVARTLHEQSRRASGPFVVFDCAAAPESLIAGELFGHVRGAFTGATRDHIGAFERAHGGTLFIDEIGELAIDLQPKLLRALETRSVRRIGDKGEQQVDVRIVAATHRDLHQMVREKTFREDLLYRLAVVTTFVPPLRDRPEDIEAIVSHFAAQLDPPPPRLPADVLAGLRTYHWPGNLRELRNLVERAAALGSWRDEVVSPTMMSLPPTPVAVAAVPVAAGPVEGRPSPIEAAADHDVPSSFRDAKENAMGRFERDYLQGLLVAHGGNLSKAARSAGMDRSHLSSLVRKHGLK